MAESITEVADDLSTKARQATPNIALLQCAWCSHEDAWPGEPRQVAALVEHCTYAHGSHVPILAVRYDVFIEGNDLALRLGAPALTEAEEKWRAEQ